MRLNRYIDEIQVIFKIYRLTLKESRWEALLFYYGFIAGFLIHLGFVYFIGHFAVEYACLVFYQLFVIGYGYVFFRNRFLDEHSPR